MKHWIISLTILFLLFCANLQAQDQYNYSDTSSTGSMSGKIKYRPNDDKLLKSANTAANATLPDLHFASFTIENVTLVNTVGTGANAVSNYKISYIAVVENIGGSISTTCDLMSEFKGKSGSYAFSDCQVFDPLAAGDSQKIDGTMLIALPAVQKIAVLRLFIDADCPKESLPAYNKVLESNESNNYSIELSSRL